jgi:fatty acid-binding protein DegV
MQAADAIQHKPLTEAQWADSVEFYQRAKSQTDALNELIKAHAEQTGKTSAQIRFAIKARADSKEVEARDDLQGRLELLGGGAES